MSRCRVSDCSGITDYDDNAQAVLCTTCGTVVTQDVLADRDGEIFGNSLYFGPTTLKSLRRIGGALAGQSTKEDRDRRNAVAMHQYIMGLLSRLACSGMAPRAHALFDQARVRGKYRWGKKAVLVAGACIAVVLREGKKGVMMSHLASLMDVSPHSLCRIFTHVNTLLSLQVPPFDPVALLPGLQSHLNSLISSPSSPLPQTTVNMVHSLPPVPVLRLATSLAILVNHLDGISSPCASAPATACALFLLALEGQALAALPSYVPLAQELGKRVGARKELVLDRYRDICKLVEKWMEEVPWIMGADHPDNKLGKKRRKTSKRDVIAMGLKDVVQFREDILKARKERELERPVTVSLEVADEEDWECATEYPSSTESSVTAGVKRKREVETTCSSKYSRLTRSRARQPLSRLDMASLFLLSPSHPLASDTLAKRRVANVTEVNDMQTQILTSVAFPTGVPHTRLQRLARVRGGEGKIKDEELFEKGELEGLLRSEDEVVKLNEFFESSSADHANTQGHPLPPSLQGFDWDSGDMDIWADFAHDKGGDKCDDPDITEQVLGDWREASPSSGRNIEEGDSFDMHCEW